MSAMVMAWLGLVLAAASFGVLAAIVCLAVLGSALDHWRTRSAVLMRRQLDQVDHRAAAARLELAVARREAERQLFRIAVDALAEQQRGVRS